ncbi:hypothetical protein B7463_g993, partial [Scytalidium lignicola]
MSSRRSSADIERRASVRTSMRLSLRHDGEEDEIDEEDYDLAAAGISDGFRPSDIDPARELRPTSISDHHMRRRTPPPPRPSSISKPKGADPFALQHDGAMRAMNLSNANPSPDTITSQHPRVPSIDVDFMRPESPYRGPAGPSHPYHMYPQVSGLARSASVTTASTDHATERSYTGPSNPAHPYGMYPQNTAPEADGPNYQSTATSTPGEVPELQPNGQPRLHPEGQDAADIIGCDAPPEQLPPYTKYPDTAFGRKAQSNVPPILVGAGGIGLATRNPEFSSQEDLNSPQSRQSTRTFSDGDSSDRDMNPAGVPDSEKAEPRLKKWQTLARRKVCHVIPVWALALAGTVIILVVLAAVAVLAVIRPGRNSSSNSPAPQSVTSWAESVTVFTTTFDATIFPSIPTNLPDLPTGTYALPIATPTVMQNTCINDPSQLKAWSCQVPPVPLQMVVNSKSESKNSGSEMIIEYQNPTMDAFSYGAQAPVMSFSWALNLVTDYQDPDRGPAWFFECPYDKLVILPETALNYTDNDNNDNSKQSISSGEVFSRDYSKMGVAQPGDKPWFCYWNGTLLEAFIYINDSDNSSSSMSSSVSSAAASVGRRHYQSYSESSTSSTSSTSGYQSSTPSPSHSYPTKSYPSATQSSSSSTTTPQQSPASASPESEMYSSSSTPNSPPSAPSPTNSGYPQDFLNPYPKPMKVEERRIPKGPDSVPPYCLQRVIKPDGSAVPYLDDNGGETVIWLDETEPSFVVPIVTNRLRKKREAELEERQASCSCGCVWVSE